MAEEGVRYLSLALLEPQRSLKQGPRHLSLAQGVRLIASPVPCTVSRTEDPQ